MVRITCVNEKAVSHRADNEGTRGTKTMSYELNLTEDQQRRIEEAQTPEEKAHILAGVAEAMLEGAELSDGDLDAVSGGVTKRMSAQEKRKAEEAVQEILEAYGPEVAQIAAEELGLC